VRARFTQYEVPGWGVGELWTDGDLVLAHEFAFMPVSDTGGAGDGDQSPATVAGTHSPRPRRSRSEADLPGGTIGALSTPSPLDTNLCLTLMELVERLKAFLAGCDVSFADVRLDLDGATPFQRAVAHALRGVPRGEVVSYGELAALAGYSGAGRAVGTFCARNRFMLLLPCHRVVGAAGIGGYGSAGVGVKRRLLALEGVVL
jgi:methylated-DNA-[protein]-cysteine S-methyltransferase